MAPAGRSGRNLTGCRPPITARTASAISTAATPPARMSRVGVPVTAQRCGEFGGPLVGEEQAGAVDLDDVSGAGGGVAQPVGPLGAEEYIAGAPADEGRDLQAGQGGLDCQQVAGVQGVAQALELAGRFRGA